MEYGLDGSENEARELVGFTCQATKWKPLIPCILDYLCSEKRPNVRRHQLPKTKPLPPVESLGPPPTKPQKPPAVNLQAFQRWTAAVPKAHRQGRKMHPPRPPRHTAGQWESQLALVPVGTPSHLPLHLSSQVTVLNCSSVAGHPSLLILTQRAWPLAGETTDLQELAPYCSRASPLPREHRI